MPMRDRLARLVRHSPERPSLRERADALKATAARVLRKPKASPSAAAVTVGSSVCHDDGTVSYQDAAGKVWRAPVSRWIAFAAMQMHARAQAEMGRQRVSAYALSTDAFEDRERQARRELRVDAVAALAFRPEREFAAAEALRSGAEPASPEIRARGDAKLRVLAPQWVAALDLYECRSQDCETICEAAGSSDVGPAPRGAGSAYDAWRRRVDEWRERTGVAEAEAASGEALAALGEIEDRIAGLPAATLAGLRIKARVAQRCDDIEIDWPDGLGSGLVRDILAFSDASGIGRPDLTDPTALSATILDGWAAWGDTLGKSEKDPGAAAAYERACLDRDGLLDAAEALPATPQAVVPKALALAWLEYVSEDRPSLPRSEHSFSGRIALDIHQMCMDRARKA